MTFSRPNRLALALARGLTQLGLILWLGGLVFFGAIAAPAIFPISRAAKHYTLGPQIAGVILHRFSFVSLLCAAFFVLGIGWEGRLLYPTGVHRRLWMTQATFSGLNLALALFLALVMLPQVELAQKTVLPLIARAENGEALSPIQAAERARFNGLHRNYGTWAQLNLVLLLVLFGLALTRGALETGAPDET